MKKIVAVLVALALCCSLAFAGDFTVEGNNGWWLGAVGSYMFQGVEVSYDMGRFTFDGSLAFPIVTVIESVIENPDSVDGIWEVIGLNQLVAAGYYSLVDSSWFSLNVGARLKMTNFYYTSSDKVDGSGQVTSEGGFGGASLIYLTPNLELKFQVSNKVSISVDGFLPGSFLFVLDDDPDTSLTVPYLYPVGIGALVPIGNKNSSSVAQGFICLFDYQDFARVSVQVKL